ncbi:MAG TPA: DUF4097 family beta strand repeat-containing protein [Streptosporangiaceae bacterium]
MIDPLPITGPRRAALAIGIPLALLSFGFAGLNLVAWAAQSSYHVNLTAPVHGRTASLTVGSGHISLWPGTPGGIHVSGTAHYAFTQPRVGWLNTSSGVILDSHCRRLNQVAGRCSFDYAVALPPGVDANVTDKAGDLTARGLASPVSLQSNAGDIRMDSLSGDVRVRARAGEIIGRDLTGAVLAASNAAGNISLTDLASQDVTVTNRAGDITLTFATIPQRVTITESAGDVNIVLPRGNTSYDIQAHTSAGHVTIGPGVVTNTASSYVISVTSRAGDITITE